MKVITEPIYNKIVSEAGARYAKLKTMSPAEIQSTVQDLKREWKAISKKSLRKTSPKKASRKKASSSRATSRK